MMIGRFFTNLKGTKGNRTNLVLFLIIGLATYLRMHRLDYQSLWLDELYTMRETDPDISWKESLNMVMLYENKSPLYFFLVKAVCSLFGHSGYVARFLSVITGLVSVYGMFALGKELFNKRTGLLAALLTAVNYFHIYYSQEARGYMFLFLFCTYSFIYFTRFLKTVSTKNAAYFGLFALLAIHFHPFGILVFLSQFILALIFFFMQEKTGRIKFAKLFGLAGLIITVGFAPLIPSLLGSNDITSSWIPAPRPDFFVAYFYTFFYDSQFLHPFLFIALISFCVFGLSAGKTSEEKTDRFGPGFVFMLISIWLLLAFLIPYLRSLLVIPVLVNRYMIIALPAVLMMLGVGIAAINNAMARYTVLWGFVVISVLELFVIQNYYHRQTKAQFRQATEFMASVNDNSYPVINEKTGWQQQYYLKRMGLTNPLLNYKKEVAVDSIIRSSLTHKDMKGFWLVGAHGEAKLSAAKQAGLDSLFIPAFSKDFNDVWAVLYLPIRNSSQHVKQLSHRAFLPADVIMYEGDSLVPFWNGEFRNSRSIELKAGKYKLSVLAKGTPCNSVFPHLMAYTGEKFIGEFDTRANYSMSPAFDLSLTKDSSIVLKLKMSNDSSDVSAREDRNGFIKTVYFLKLGK